MCDLTCISIMVVSKWLHEACRILLIIFKDSWNLEVRPGDTTSKECEYGLFIVSLQSLCSVMYECTKSFNQLEAVFLNYRTDQEYLRAIKNIEGCPEVSHSWWFVNSTSYFMTPSFLRRVKDRRQDKLPPTVLEEGLLLGISSEIRWAEGSQGSHSVFHMPQAVSVLYLVQSAFLFKRKM